jgi:gliding motility-associated-like protein
MRILTTIFFIAFLLGTTHGIAQYTSSPNPPGSFSVDQVKGCVPFTVTIAAPDCDGNPGCGMLLDINDPASTGKELFHNDPNRNKLTYTEPGTYTMLVAIGSQNSTIQITALPSPLPTFEAYACTGSQVAVKITDTNNYNSYIVEYADGGVQSLAKGAKDVHGPLTPGVQNIKVRGVYTPGAADNCPSSVTSINIPAAFTTPSITQLEAVSATEIQLDLNAQPSVLHQLQIATNGTTSFQNLPPIANTNSLTISSNIRPDDNYYCFHISAIDFCNNSIQGYSPTVCSVNFDVTAANNQNDFAWVTSTAGVVSSEITRDGTSLPPGAVTSKKDTDIICNTAYTYQFISNYSGARSLSIPKTVTSISNNVPPPVDNITAVVHPDGLGVDLTWPPDALDQSYSIYRGADLAGTSTVESFTDDAYTTENSQCYRVRYDNTCGAAGPLGTESCPLQLSSVLQKDNSVTLAWTPYEGWDDSVEKYSIEKYTASGQLVATLEPETPLSLTYEDPNDPSDLVNQTFIYVVKAQPVDGGVGIAVSNAIRVTKRAKLVYPNAFTPNNDGNNDVFELVIGQFVSSFEMKVFNRWGELVYSTTNEEDKWDGTYRGIELPEGTYAIMASLTDFEGKIHKHSGSIVILRRK